MKKPDKCPECGALYDEISNAKEMCDFIGIDSSEYKEWWCNSCQHNFDAEDSDMSSPYDSADFSKMSLGEISDVIFHDWRNDLSPYAEPYADAMRDFDNINDIIGTESAASVVSYFLANAKGWRGETAREVKKVLRKMLADHAKK